MNEAEKISSKIAIDLKLKYATQVNLEAVINKMLPHMGDGDIEDCLTDLIENIFRFETN